MNFRNLQTTKYGEQAEDMFLNEFINKQRVMFLIGHQYSNLIQLMQWQCLGIQLFMSKLKRRAGMLRYDNTGIDLADWELYKTFPHPTYIIFADPASKKALWTMDNKAGAAAVN